MSTYKIGEYIIGYVLASTQKKVQLSLKPNLINQGLKFDDINVNQV